jgi:hydrogenase maturation factor HypF (carbamoyltransferase family)
MNFIDTEIEVILPLLEKLEANSNPSWGKMSAQRMIEHLTDTLRIAIGTNPQKLEIEEEKLPRMIAFLESDKEMAKNIVVPFAQENEELRNSEIELAVDEYIETYLEFQEVYEENSKLKNIHPYYGPLNYQQWKRLHSKHVTHHFQQFSLI